MSAYFPRSVSLIGGNRLTLAGRVPSQLCFRWDESSQQVWVVHGTPWCTIAEVHVDKLCRLEGWSVNARVGVAQENGVYVRQRVSEVPLRLALRNEPVCQGMQLRPGDKLEVQLCSWKGASTYASNVRVSLVALQHELEELAQVGLEMR